MPVTKPPIEEPIDAPVYKPLDDTKVPVEVTTKYQLRDNTLIQQVKTDVADKIEVEIGDTKTPDAFMPQVKVMRWDNEVNFSMRHIDEEPGQPVIEYDGEKVMYKKPKIEVHQYDKPEAGEDGGFEFEWVLNEKPATNELKASIRTKGLEFYYQPPLTEEEIAEGASRPENVVGSYAVYHSTKRDNIVGGKEYKTGKAFHIYRPEAIDAEGNRTWCDINIDVDGELATVTVPQEFLDKAVYPVIVDPTLGYTSMGASNTYYIASTGSDLSQTWGYTYSLNTHATVSDINIGLVTDSTSETLDLYAAIYAEDSAGSGSHDRLFSAEKTSETITNSAAFVTFTVSSPLLSYGKQNYILAALGDGNDMVTSAKSIYIKTDSGGSSRNVYNESSTGSSSYTTRKNENPWTETASTTTNQPSYYITYTAVSMSDAGYANCHAITIDNTKVSGTGDLTDFPILIAGTYDGTGGEPDLRVTGSGGDVTSSSGYDIEFSSDSAGNTKLAHQIEKYVSTTGEIYAWVKVPTLDGDADTTIYMWFGNSNVTASTEQASSVWDSNFKYVEHFEEAAGTLTDSTSNAVTATALNTPTYRATGISSGYGVDLEESSDQTFYRTSSPFYDMTTSNTTEFTVEAWVKLESSQANPGRTLIYQGAKGNFQLRIDTSTLRAYVVQSDGSVKTCLSDSAFNTGTWYYAVFTWKKNNYINLYRNGVVDDTPVATSDLYLKDETTASNSAIGSYYTSGAGQKMDGVLDEIRISNVVRSADWIATTYETIANPSTFYSVGTTNLVGGGGGGSTWIPKVIFM